MAASAAARRASTAAAGSSAPKTAEPATKTSAPASAHRSIVVGGDAAVDLQPHRLLAAADQLPGAADLGSTTSRNDWPPKPGSTVMTSSMSSSGSRSAYGSTAVRRLERHAGARAGRAEVAGQPHRARRRPRRGT